MCVFMLDDAAGSIEIVVFPETFKQHGHLADNGQSVLVKGKFEHDDESARIIASESWRSVGTMARQLECDAMIGPAVKSRS